MPKGMTDEELASLEKIGDKLQEEFRDTIRSIEFNQKCIEDDTKKRNKIREQVETIESIVARERSIRKEETDGGS